MHDIILYVVSVHAHTFPPVCVMPERPSGRPSADHVHIRQSTRRRATTIIPVAISIKNHRIDVLAVLLLLLQTSTSFIVTRASSPLGSGRGNGKNEKAGSPR